MIFVLAVPGLLWLEGLRGLPQGYVETGSAPSVVGQLATPTILLVNAPPPTPLPVGAPIAVQPPPVQPVLLEPTPSELIPIPPEVLPTIEAVPPTPELVIPVYWPEPTIAPVIEFAQVAQTALTEAGYTFSQKPTIGIPRNLVGP